MQEYADVEKTSKTFFPYGLKYFYRWKINFAIKIIKAKHLFNLNKCQISSYISGWRSF